MFLSHFSPPPPPPLPNPSALFFLVALSLGAQGYRRPGVPSVCFGALRQSTSEAGSADSRTPHPLLRGVGRACVLDSSPVKCLLSVSGGSEACRPGPALRGLEVGACGPRPPFSVAVAGRAGEGRERTRPRPQTAGGSCFPSAPSSSVAGLGSVSARASARITRKLPRPPRGARLGPPSRCGSAAAHPPTRRRAS